MNLADPGRRPVKRALLSVYDKTGLVDFARGLADEGVELLSTGGTARALREAGLKVLDVSELTKYPELFDGRVKTLHPAIHGGLLARRANPQDMEHAEDNGIGLIDLVVVTLYPFEEVSRKPDVDIPTLIENIDIGGPSMLRSAAKNHEDVTVICDTRDYEDVLAEIREGGPLRMTRQQLAVKVFTRTAAYDGLIGQTLGRRFEGLDTISKEVTPPVLSLTLPRTQELRYGENPHQKAAVYGDLGALEVLHGKQLSYNNLLDVDAALSLNKAFAGEPEPVCAILKHTNPCGVAQGATPAEAFERAFACDTRSPFGGIVIWNRPVDLATAEAVHKPFMEILLAPSFDEEALALLKRKKDRRLVRFGSGAQPWFDFRMSSFFGGLLVQGHDRGDHTPGSYDCVTKRRPDSGEFVSLLFAWSVCRYVKSNAIVLAREGRTIGIGAGQMSRVDACEIAVHKARLEGHDLQGSVLASDAFFPFADSIEEAAKAGVKAIIQPGGSVRDAEVIEAADRLGMTMLFTGYRHFRH